MLNKVKFFLNGRAVTIKKPPADLLLIDYMRSPEVALAGPKKPCGQGGCGGCTVILSHWDTDTNSAVHSAINSCLRPVVSLNGLVVTTVEGTGSVRRPNLYDIGPGGVSGRAGMPLDAPTSSMNEVEAQEARIAKQKAVEQNIAETLKMSKSGVPLSVKLREVVPIHPSEHTNEGMNPVAWRLAMNNGSQCGYCSVGFVMNMSEFLVNNPQATKRDIEGAMDGNLCRCTGYRAILTGMKTFASDWTEEDEKNRMKCLPDNDAHFQRPTDSLIIPFPCEARTAASGINVIHGRHQWYSPPSLQKLVDLLQQHQADMPRMVGANTAFGIYPEEYLKAKVLIDLRFVPELHTAPYTIGTTGEGAGQSVVIPAGTTYSALIPFLASVMRDRGEMTDEPGSGPNLKQVPKDTTRLGVLYYMARRTAGRIVRNAATLGGNTMLVLHHIQSGSGAPFPSDAVTAMVAAGAELEYVDTSLSGPVQIQRAMLADLVAQVVLNPALADSLILVAYHVPCGSDAEVLYPQKVALREVNAHSIVNATTRILLNPALVAEEVVLVFGAIAPYPWRAVETEKMMTGQVLSLATIGPVALCLQQEVRAELAKWHGRMAEQPAEGFTDEYRTQLAVSFLYKAMVNALSAKGGAVPPDVYSSGEITFDRWAVSDGTQSYVNQKNQGALKGWKFPVAEPFIKQEAMAQASGQVHYTHELPVPPLTVNASFVQSKRVLASWQFCLPDSKEGDNTNESGGVDELRTHLSALYPGVFVDLITSHNFKDGQINLQGMGSDQPIFAVGNVQYAGQSLALVCANGQEQAATIADYVTNHCVRYGPPTEPVQPPPSGNPSAPPPLPDWQVPPSWWATPVLSIDQAIALNSIYPDNPTSAGFNSHIWQITRPGSQFDWAQAPFEPLDKNITDDHCGMVDGIPCHIITNTQAVGGQIHFYMEPQAAIAEPVDGRRIIVRPSSQSPLEMHTTVALALANQFNRIEVHVPALGGGFGGKTEQAKFVVGAAAVAAYAQKRPVRLTLTREQDTGMIGKRHAYYGKCRIAIDSGTQNPANKGIIHGMMNSMWGDGGAFYDCSFIVSNCIQMRADNAYRVRNFRNQIDVCRTNTAPSTAFRAFGDIQGKLITENAIDDAAFSIGMSAEDVRRKNMYVPGDVTPFGQALSVCYITDVWDYLKDKAGYQAKVDAVNKFNSENRWRKRGVAMIPVKYGSGYNLVMLEQAGAMISIYQGDGSLVIHQGGVDMGQGLLTQIRQIAAYVLNVPMDLIEVQQANTAVTPNPSSTGGSTGTAYNGEAVKRLCQQMRARLTAFAQSMLLENGDEWCKDNGIDYWNYVERGWRSIITFRGKKVMIWQNLITLAYQNRISLIETFTAPIHGGETQAPALTYKPYADQPKIPGYTSDPGWAPGEVDNFVGFTFSAACAVTEVDILTGEVKILSADIAYDMGWSLNQAIDIGQVEGAFVQGIGYILSEKLVFEPKTATPNPLNPSSEGALNTLNTWTYKPPAVCSIPLELNTHLFPRDLVAVPPSPNDGVFSSKEVGEPPLVLAASVFFAAKAAIRASRLERGLSGLFRFDAPATVQEVQRVCEVSPEQLSA